MILAMLSYFLGLNLADELIFSSLISPNNSKNSKVCLFGKTVVLLLAYYDTLFINFCEQRLLNKIGNIEKSYDLECASRPKIKKMMS